MLPLTGDGATQVVLSGPLLVALLVAAAAGWCRSSHHAACRWCRAICRTWRAFPAPRHLERSARVTLHASLTLLDGGMRHRRAPPRPR